ncbi:MAG: DUF3822 family protein [Bacteroidia bacterium]
MPTIPETGSKIPIEHNIRDDSFNRETSSQCNLYLMLADDQWIHAAFDGYAQKFLLLKSYPRNSRIIFDYVREITQLKALHEELSYHYKTITFCISHRKATLVPQSLFLPELLKNYYELNHPYTPAEELNSASLKKSQAELVYAVERYMSQGIRKHFPNAKIIHAAAPFLENTMARSKNEKAPLAFVDVDQTHFRIAVKRGDTLELYNTFQYKTKTDLLYYLLFVSDQAQLNPDKDTYYFSGFLYKNSETFDLLFEYFRNIEFTPLPNSFHYSYRFNAIPAHFYATVFSLPLCE